MSADKPKERAEARRLVEEAGRSLTAAAAEVGVDERSVRRWQRADERAGNPWRLAGSSAAQKARADAMSPEERADLVERARQATALRWENRRRAEADAAGVMASSLRQQLMNTLPQYARALLEEGTEGDTAGIRPMRLASAVKQLGIAYAVSLDKADRLAGVEPAALVDGPGDGDGVGDLMEAQSLFAEIQTRRLRAV